MPSHAVGLTPPAAAAGHRPTGYYQLYVSDKGVPVREGAIYWIQWRAGSGESATGGTAIAFVIRIYSPPGGDNHDVLVDIMYGGTGAHVEQFNMEYKPQDSARFELKEEEDVWTLYDGWFDTVSADKLQGPVQWVHVWAADGTDPGDRQPLECEDEMVRLAGVAPVHRGSHKLLSPMKKLLPGGAPLRQLLSDYARNLMQPPPAPVPHDGAPFSDPLIIPRATVGEVASGPNEGALLRVGGSIESGFVRAVRITDGTTSRVIIPHGGSGGTLVAAWEAVPAEEEQACASLTAQPRRNRAWFGVLVRELVIRPMQQRTFDLSIFEAVPVIIVAPCYLALLNLHFAPDELYSFETFVGSDGLRAAPPPLFRRSLLVISREIAPPGSRLRETTIRQLQIAIVAQTSGKEAPRKLIHARIVLEGISFAAFTSLDTWPVAEWTGDRHTGIGYDFESADEVADTVGMGAWCVAPTMKQLRDPAWHGGYMMLQEGPASIEYMAAESKLVLKLSISYFDRNGTFQTGAQPDQPPRPNMKYTMTAGWQDNTFVVTRADLEAHTDAGATDFTHYRVLA